MVATGGVSGSMAGTDSPTHVRFEVTESGRASFGSVPFPDDLFRDAEGKVQVTGIADDATWLPSLSSLDGFGTQGPIFFELDGDIDTDSLPADSAASVEENASVFLIDVDTNSPTAFTRLPVRVTWLATERRLVVSPLASLAPRRRYAAVITREVRDKEGQRIGPSTDFVLARGQANGLQPSVLDKARENYAPVLEALAQRGLAREEVAGLSVFRVQSVQPEMEEALERVRQAGADSLSLSAQVSGAALDAVLGNADGLPGIAATGVAHANVTTMAHGTFQSPQLLSRTAFVHGAFGRDESGLLAIRRVEDVPFSIMLPRTVDPVQPLSVVAYLHGAGADRSDALALVDRFAASNLVVVTVDAPYHGQRNESGDERNRFTGASEADGFGDGVGDFFGATDTAGPLEAGHPFYYRDGLRQWALDVVHLLDLLRDSAVVPQELANLDVSRVALIGVDVGFHVALMVAALAEGVELVAGAFAGGPTMESWIRSPAQTDRTAELLAQMNVPLEVDAALLSPEVSLYQSLLDRADPMAWATAINRRSTNVLLLAVEGDETVDDSGSVALAGALGATVDDSLSDVTYAEGVTRGLVKLGPGAHNTLISAQGERLFDFNGRLPAMLRREAASVANPIDQAQTTLLRFVESWRACVQAGGAAPCRAQLPEAL